MRQLAIDPHTVWQKQEKWDCSIISQRSIQIPSHDITSVPKTPANIPPWYIHPNIVYPDENVYSCDEEDVRNGIDPVMMQQVDIQRNLNQSKNFCRQQSLLNGQEYDEEYYDYKVQKLGRPLLRVFMRASENEFRCHAVFRARKPYKQKRQKRLNFNEHEYEAARQILAGENNLAIMQLDLIRQREQLKLKLIQAQRQQFLEQEPDIDYQLNIPQTKDILMRLKELRLIFKEEDPIEITRETRNKFFDSCNINDCSYQFKPFVVQNSLIEFMDDQFNQIKDRQIIWPKQPTMIRDGNVVNQFNRLGVRLMNHQLVYGNLDRTMVITDRTKKHKKKIKLQLIDKNKSTVCDGVRANYDHFLSHYTRTVFKQEMMIESVRKEQTKQRQEIFRKEQLMRLQQKKEEERQQLRIRFSLAKLMEPPKQKTVRIKHSQDTYFQLIKDDTTRITLRMVDDRVILKD